MTVLTEFGDYYTHRFTSQDETKASSGYTLDGSRDVTDVGVDPLLAYIQLCSVSIAVFMWLCRRSRSIITGTT